MFGFAKKSDIEEIRWDVNAHILELKGEIDTLKRELKEASAEPLYQEIFPIWMGSMRADGPLALVRQEKITLKQAVKAIADHLKIDINVKHESTQVVAEPKKKEK